MKIDIVYTWVDGSDPNWNKKRKDKIKSLDLILPEANSEARFMDNDELLYSLRSINMFAPWANNIFIITDEQIPKWLNTSHPKIKIIDHKDIFKDKSVLPTYSARGIESQIHHIDELSEHFIYFNDDMFLGNHCEPEYFFPKEKIAHVFVSEIIAIPSKKSFDISKRPISVRNDHQHAIVNTRKIIRDRFNKSIYYNVRHGAKPLLKSVLNEIEEIFKQDLERTSKNSFRTKEDILMFHLFEYYALIRKLGKPKYLKTVSKKATFLDSFSSIKNKYTFGYVNLHDNNVKFSLEQIEIRKPFMICLNQTPSTPKENLKMINDFLPKFFNTKSPFEN